MGENSMSSLSCPEIKSLRGFRAGSWRQHCGQISAAGVRVLVLSSLGLSDFEF